jgi:hypothetical protein
MLILRHNGKVMVILDKLIIIIDKEMIILGKLIAI